MQHAVEVAVSVLVKPAPSPAGSSELLRLAGLPLQNRPAQPDPLRSGPQGTEVRPRSQAQDPLARVGREQMTGLGCWPPGHVVSPKHREALQPAQGHTAQPGIRGWGRGDLRALLWEQSWQGVVGAVFGTLQGP